MTTRSEADLQVIRDTTMRWVDEVVIGLNLCPFAKAVVAKGQLRLIVSEATETDAVADTLADALAHLARTPEKDTDTTLIVAPDVLHDFADYNDFLGVADAIVDGLGFRGTFQIASFHPRYQFEGTHPDDAGNLTNRAPYPMLHILREESVGRAVDAFPNAETIYERNIETVEALTPTQVNTLFPYLRRKS